MVDIKFKIDEAVTKNYVPKFFTKDSNSRFDFKKKWNTRQVANEDELISQNSKEDIDERAIIIHDLIMQKVVKPINEELLFS